MTRRATARGSKTRPPKSTGRGHGQPRPPHRRRRHSEAAPARESPKPGARGPGPGFDRILAVAIRSFAERGYEGTTTAGVARDAGVTQPLVHHHFGSKEGLWRAAMEALFANVPRVALAPTDASLPDRLLAVAEQVVRFVAANPELTRVMAREGAAPSPRLTHLIDCYLREPFRRVVDAVRAGQRAGLIVPDVRPDLLPFLVLGAASHLFDVGTLAQQTLGIDTTAARTREDIVVLVRALLEHGLFRQTTKRSRA